MKKCMSWLAASMVVATLGAGRSMPASAADSSPTFTKDVAPILMRSCVQCHRPGQVAPMSLLSFEDVRPWARSIKTRVTKREMPELSDKKSRVKKIA